MRAILETAAQTGDSAEMLVNSLDGPSSRLLTAALVDATEIPQPGRQLQDLVTRLRDRFLDRQLANLTRLLAQPNLPEEELLRTLEEQRDLLRQKQEVLPKVPIHCGHIKKAADWAAVFGFKNFYSLVRV